MSNRLKKQASSLSFSLSRWFRKISTAEPSTTLIMLLVIGASIFLFGGGLYDIIVQPLPAIYYGQKFYFLYPELSSQFLFDTVIAVILYMMGFAGLLFMYQSSKNAYNPRQAYMSMILGAALVFIAYIFLEYYIHLKIAGG